jgi:hypothetical protein
MNHLKIFIDEYIEINHLLHPNDNDSPSLYVLPPYEHGHFDSSTQVIFLNK